MSGITMDLSSVCLGDLFYFVNHGHIFIGRRIHHVSNAAKANEIVVVVNPNYRNKDLKGQLEIALPVDFQVYKYLMNVPGYNKNDKSKIKDYSKQNVVVQVVIKAELKCIAKGATKSDSKKSSKSCRCLLSGNDKLIRGVNENNIQQVNEAIYEGADIHKKDNSLLYKAISQNNIDIVDSLLINGANLHAEQEKALTLACELGHVSMVKFLVLRGANVYANNGKAFSTAKKNKNEEICKFLDDMVKCKVKRDEQFKAALKCLGGSRNNKASEQASLFGSAESEIDIYKFKELLQSINTGSSANVKKLVESGVNVNAENGEALICAVDRNNYNIVQYLLKHGCDMWQRDGNAFYIACLRGFFPIVETMIKYNKNIVNIRDGDCLSAASYNGHCFIMDALIKAGIALGDNKQKAILAAIQGKHPEAVAFLEGVKEDKNGVVKDNTLPEPAKNPSSNTKTPLVEGVKYDQDKPRMELLVPDFIKAMGEIMSFGAKKYTVDNWKKVTPLRERYIGAAFRHLLDYMRGDVICPDSNLPHTAHAATCLMFLYWNDHVNKNNNGKN